MIVIFVFIIFFRNLIQLCAFELIMIFRKESKVMGMLCCSKVVQASSNGIHQRTSTRLESTREKLKKINSLESIRKN